MRKFLMRTAVCLLLMASASVAMAVQQGDGKKEVMTKEADGTYVVNTRTLAKDVIGYRSTTPVKIYIKKDKVEKVVALRNQETPKYFAKIKAQLMDAWNGLKVSKAQKLKVDAVTGATMSSDAVAENVKRGLEYYKKNKK